MDEMKILHLEDQELASVLLQEWLLAAGKDWEVCRVDTRDAFLSALDKGGYGLIVSDYRLPAYDGLQALRDAKARRPDVPFLFFSANLGQERAIDALKSGATDYVAKGDEAGRLVPALVRAVQEADERAARRRAEDALRQQEAGFRLLFDCNPHPMWVFDVRSLEFLEVNRAAIEHYGYSRDEFLTMRITDICPPEDVPLVEEAVRIVQTGVRRFGPWLHRTRSGKTIHVDIAAHDLEFRGHVARIVVVSDITGQKELESQLLQAQKLDAIGRLAGGIAHDFNNLLGVIVGYGERVARRLPAEERREIGEVLKAADHAAALTHQLLAFSRRQVLQPRVMDVNAVVADLNGMLRRIIGEDIHLITVLKDGVGRVKADHAQMQQVIMNLTVNARDAMPRGGTLTIETDNVNLDESYVSAHNAVRSGRYVMLAVTDTGEGMDKDTQARIFEPFFTTKGAGRGTGLGLATVFGIVKQSGGDIWVYSERFHGTTFKVYLPRVDEPLAGEASAPTRVSGGTETVMIVEDADNLRQLAREILTEQGYNVVEARSGPEAVALLETHAARFDLLLTDLVMPGMSGRELADKAAAVRPGIKVLFMSGYTDDALGNHGALDPGMALIEKPFTVDLLLRRVRESLDAES